MSDREAAAVPPPTECDFCRRSLEAGEPCYQLLVGLSESGRVQANTSFVEETHEATLCARCEPEVSSAVDDFLTRLWQLRAPDGTEGNPEAYHQVIDCDRDPDTEPDTERRPCLSTVKTS